MAFIGQVKDGVVVFDEGNRPEEGIKVRVEPIPDPYPAPNLADKLLDLAGSAEDLPTDLARNHDHYLHARKRK